MSNNLNVSGSQGVDKRTEFKMTTGVSVWREISELYSERSDGILGHGYDRPPPKSGNVLTYWASTDWSYSKQQPVLLLVIVSSEVIYFHRSYTSHTSVGSNYRTDQKQCQCLKGASILCTISHTMALWSTISLWCDFSQFQMRTHTLKTTL
jgi:hypothetical protein